MIHDAMISNEATKQRSKEAKQQRSKAAKQQRSKEAKKQSSKEAKEAKKQRSKEAIFFLWGIKTPNFRNFVFLPLDGHFTQTYPMP